MQPEVSINWFLAQALLAGASFWAGRALGKRSHSLSEIAIACVVALTVGWALRDRAQDALLGFVPLHLWVYVEGTLIVPPFMLLAGALSADGERVRLRRMAPWVACFGALYFVHQGEWMLRPQAQVEARSPMSLTQASTWQSRRDTCVAAAMATALRAPGIGIPATEAQMVELADVRAGSGSTMARALRGLRVAMAGDRYEPRLVTLGADETLAVATRDVPALVTLRSGRTRAHMVVVYGRTRDGRVRVFNPESGSAHARGGLMEYAEFRSRYMGSAIIFQERVAVALGDPALWGWASLGVAR